MTEILRTTDRNDSNSPLGINTGCYDAEILKRIWSTGMPTVFFGRHRPLMFAIKMASSMSPGQHALAIIEYGNTEIRMSVSAYLLA